MRREGTPAWMQVVERRLEQAAEEARSRPARARTYSPRHSGAGRNPVVYSVHSRSSGNALMGPEPVYHPGVPSWIPAFAGMTTRG